MPQIKRMLMSAVLLVVVMFLVSGCGDPNPQAPFSTDKQSHPVAWFPAGHVLPAQSDPGSCRECHGDDLSGGISKVSCMGCHENGSPYVLTGCTSCHGNPPSGTVAPDRDGAHGAHNALANVTGICDTCHSGAGSGTQNHDNNIVNVAFLNEYNAKSGAAVWNADGTCSKVSCHGGQTTPAWLSGTTIDVSTQCDSCHAFGTSEYNSYVSGWHWLHVNVDHFPCDRCHDATLLSPGHFQG